MISNGQQNFTFNYSAKDDAAINVQEHYFFPENISCSGTSFS